MLTFLRRYRSAFLIAAVFVAAVYLEVSHARGPREQSYAAATQSAAVAPSQARQQVIGVEANQQSDAARQSAHDTDKKSNYRPVVATVAGSKARINPAENCDYECQRRAEEASEYWTIHGHRTKITDFWLAIFTGLLFVVSSVQGAILFCQIRLARQEFIATHKPIIKVRAAVLDQAHRDDPLSGPHTVSGRFIVGNSGDTAATIAGSHIELCWSNGGIPLTNIYETMPGGSLADQDAPLAHGITLPPGRHLVVPFANRNSSVVSIGAGRTVDATHRDTTIIGQLVTTSVETGGDEPVRLYLFGWIRFRDGNNVERQTGFCRVHDTDEFRFMPVGDPELEY
jgi:hypothetical protein